MRVEFYRHGLGDEAKRALAEALDSTFLTAGPRTEEFETRFAGLLGAGYCVGMSSWTTAAFLTLKSMEIGAGDEVITSPLTFVASANVILHAGAIPVFVDVEPRTGNLDAEKVEAAITSRTRAILPVHLYGQMCDMARLHRVASRHGLRILEDAAHCVEGNRDGHRPGALGDAAAFSFYATKNLTCGEGGAVVTNDEDLYRRLRKYRLHGIGESAAQRHGASYRHWDMEFLGYKANMYDLQAALLLSQLDGIEARLRRREEICRRYEQGFSGLDGVGFPLCLPGSRSGRHLFTVWVDPALRDRTLAALQRRGVGVAVNYRAMHLLSYYSDRFGYARGSFPAAEKIGDSTITLPLYPALSDSEVDYVIESLAASLREAEQGTDGDDR